MSKAAVLLVGVACSAIAWQNKPTLKRVGTSNVGVSAIENLDSFMPLHKVWPDVTTTLTNGSRVSVSALIANGKPYEYRVTGDADQSVAKPLLDALKQWRFAMPKDGTSPVRFTVIWEAQDGKFVVGETDIGKR